MDRDIQKLVHDFMHPPPIRLTAPPYRCGTLTPDNPLEAIWGHPQGPVSENMGLDWSGELSWTEGGTAIIRGEKPDSEPNEGD